VLVTSIPPLLPKHKLALGLAVLVAVLTNSVVFLYNLTDVEDNLVIAVYHTPVKSTAALKLLPL